MKSNVLLQTWCVLHYPRGLLPQLLPSKSGTAYSLQSKNRSSLSIAHRLSTIINSDQIVVMKDGQVVEAGSYTDLLDKDGVFASMWKKQIHTEAEIMAAAQSGENLLLSGGRKSRSSLGSPAGSERKGRDEAHGQKDKKDENAEDKGNDGGAETPVEVRDFEYEPTPTDTPAEAEGSSTPTKSKAAKETTTEPESYADAVKAHATPVTDQSATSPPASTAGASATTTPKSESKAFPRLTSTTTRSPSNSQSDSSSPKRDEGGKEKDGKARKRLSSIKGFVRRISDQGMTRSPSWNAGKGRDEEGTGFGSVPPPSSAPGTASPLRASEGLPDTTEGEPTPDTAPVHANGDDGQGASPSPGIAEEGKTEQPKRRRRKSGMFGKNSA